MNLKNRNIYSCLWALLLLACFASCSDDDENNEKDYANQQTDFVSFTIRGHEDAVTTIDKESHTVTVRMPESVTDGSKLIPEFTTSEGTRVSIDHVIQYSGYQMRNFNNVVKYTVATPDYKIQQTWNVVVTNNEYTVKYGLGHFLTASRSNDGDTPFYMQQQHTGQYSGQNCGPAVVAMALKWYDPSSTFTVEDIRNQSPQSTYGGVSWYSLDVGNALKRNGITNTFYWKFPSTTSIDYIVNTLCSEIDNNNLAMVCLNSASLSTWSDIAKENEYHANCYYSSNGGHWLLLKGYRVVDGKTWFEVHDPWGLDLKYKDGSYYGANRYHLASEIATCKDWNIWAVIAPHK